MLFEHIRKRKIRRQLARGHHHIILTYAAKIIPNRRKRFHAPAETRIAVARYRRQHVKSAVFAAQIPVLAASEVVDHALVFFLEYHAHIGHPGVDHAREHEIYHTVAAHERKRVRHAELHKLLQLRSFAVGENYAVHRIVHRVHFLATFP
ncbi:hypothetical protein SDC9_176688 [bioreactor metagenome]|uniref:Uncharacterized protein n=1 Tax=bioreactor metagenome TaxID=1076179 RepID=A0A645GQS2_9ZZZZ